MLKDDYMGAIKAAGFSAVKVVNETTYPLDLFLDDDMAKDIMKDLKLTREQVKDISASIARCEGAGG